MHLKGSLAYHQLLVLFTLGSRVPDEATKQYIQNLKTEIANLEQVIAANNSKVTALEKELITERGYIIIHVDMYELFHIFDNQLIWLLWFEDITCYLFLL